MISLGRENPKYRWHTVLDDLNSFITNRVTAKFNYFSSLFGNEKHSKPNINTGIHFDSRNSKVASSDAVLPTLPKALTERKKTFLGDLENT